MLCANSRFIRLPKKITKIVYYAKYSTMSKTLVDTGRNGYDTETEGKRPLLFTNNVFKKSKRPLTMQGIIEWQQGVYSSISNSYLVELIQSSLLKVHEVSGLPWWMTIVGTTIMIRSTMTLPLSIYQNYILAKVENIGVELGELMNDLRKETAIASKMYNLSDRKTYLLYKASVKKQWRLLVERDNCHPFKASLVLWLQIPIWVCMSFAIRNFVNMQPISDAAAMVTFKELSVGGFGWIPNLIEPDVSWIFPVTLGIVNLSIIEIQALSKIRKPSKIFDFFTNTFRVFSLVMIPVAASVPSSLCLYWVTSSTFGLIQNLVLLSPSVRRKLNIPEAPSELEDPYTHIKQEMKNKILRLNPNNKFSQQ